MNILKLFQASKPDRVEIEEKSLLELQELAAKGKEAEKLQTEMQAQIKDLTAKISGLESEMKAKLEDWQTKFKNLETENATLKTEKAALEKEVAQSDAFFKAKGFDRQTKVKDYTQTEKAEMTAEQWAEARELRQVSQEEYDAFLGSNFKNFRKNQKIS